MMPTSTYMWDHFGDPNSSPRSSLPGIPQSNDVYSPNEALQSLFDFCTEINLQQELTGYATSATDVLSTYDDSSPHAERTANSNHAAGFSSERLSPDDGLDAQNIN